MPAVWRRSSPPGTILIGRPRRFAASSLRPAATNVKIRFEGGDVYDLEPPTLPNLFHGQPIRLYGRYRNSGPAKVNIQAEIQGSPLDQTVSVDLPKSEEANPQIDRMWASHRVSRLMDENRAAGSESHRDEIVRLCEGYSIVSQYASFLVLENDAEYQRWQIERRNATRVQRDRAAQVALRKQLDRLRNEALEPGGTAQRRGRPGGRLRLQATRSPRSPRRFPRTPCPLPPAAPSRGWDIQMPRGGGGGGGAIDPFTVLFGVGLAGLGLAARRSARRRKSQEPAPASDPTKEA